MKNALITLALSGIALGFAGCDSGPRGPAGARPDPIVSAAYPNITVDGSLAKFIAVDYDAIVFQAPTTDRPLFVQVPARSQADNEYSVQYNFEFFSADRVKVGETGYKTITIPSRRQVQLTGNAITSKATLWRLDIRSAR
ncbi:MAG: hypothetical protein K2W85_00620 [Phycisphaerales bacterium]|nr:hypothetical protein [Phycisphaerales bacterium]